MNLILKSNISKYRIFRESVVLGLDTRSNKTYKLGKLFLLLDTIINEKTVKLMQLDTILAL